MDYGDKELSKRRIKSLIMNISFPSFLILVLVLINTRYSGIQGDILRNTRYSGIQGDIEEYKIFRDTGGY